MRPNVKADRNAASDLQFVIRALPRFRSSGLLGLFMERQRIEERSINYVSVTVITEKGCDVANGEYQLLLDHFIGTLDIGRGGDIELIADVIANSVDELHLPESGVTQVVLKESGEWGDPHWQKYYVIERIVRVS